MANGMVALQAQKQECEAAIAGIRDTAPEAVCPAHNALAGGVVALLRTKIAEIDVHCEQRMVRGKRFWDVAKMVLPSLMTILVAAVTALVALAIRGTGP